MSLKPAAVSIAMILGLTAGGCSPLGPEVEPVEFPQSLQPTGDGFPAAGDVCRLLIINSAVQRWADEGPELVGCPTESDARAIGGSTVGIVDGFYIIATAEVEQEEN